MSIWRQHQIDQLLPKVNMVADSCRKYIFIYQCDMLGIHTIVPKEMTLEELEKIWEAYCRDERSQDPKRIWNIRNMELSKKMDEFSTLWKQVRQYYGGRECDIPSEIKKAYDFDPIYGDKKNGIPRSQMTQIDDYIMRLKFLLEHLPL